MLKKNTTETNSISSPIPVNMSTTKKMSYDECHHTDTLSYVPDKNKVLKIKGN